MLWVVQPPLAAVAQWSARSLDSGLGRFRAAKFCLRVGWVAEWGPKLGEAGAGVPIEMLLPLRTDSVTLTERPQSPDPGRGSGGEVAVMGGHSSEWKRGPA